VQLSVEGKQPGASMPVVATQVADYLSALWNWTPWPEASGVGFHTTDGTPQDVAKSRQQGGWGGITRPQTVGFFRTRYALDQSWNPLGTWLEGNGPTFRTGIKDNELLSTVSIATDLHGSVRFPLADTPGRRGRSHVPNPNPPPDGLSFEMEVSIFAVRVRSGYATFAKQGANAFGEIATGDIPIEDIIGWSRMTRWHPYSAENADVPLTIGFRYVISPFQRNPAFPAGGIHDRLFAAAKAEIDREVARSNQPYQG